MAGCSTGSCVARIGDPRPTLWPTVRKLGQRLLPSAFWLLAACLGLELAHERNQIRFRDPVMPDFLDEVVIRNLRLGPSRVDVRLHRYGADVTANVLAREGSLRVAVLK